MLSEALRFVAGPGQLISFYSFVTLPSPYRISPSFAGGLSHWRALQLLEPSSPNLSMLHAP